MRQTAGRGLLSWTISSRPARGQRWEGSALCSTVAYLPAYLPSSHLPIMEMEHSGNGLACTGWRDKSTMCFPTSSSRSQPGLESWLRPRRAKSELIPHRSTCRAGATASVASFGSHTCTAFSSTLFAHCFLPALFTFLFIASFPFPIPLAVLVPSHCPM